MPRYTTADNTTVHVKAPNRNEERKADEEKKVSFLDYLLLLAGALGNEEKNERIFFSSALFLPLVEVVLRQSATSHGVNVPAKDIRKIVQHNERRALELPSSNRMWRYMIHGRVRFCNDNFTA